jgi:hypothetical protein
MVMTAFKKYFGSMVSIILFLLVMPSCSTVPVLSINYRAPVKTNQLEGKKVFLEIKDSRADRDMLGEGAKEDFNGQSEGISLSVAEGEEKGFKIGVFPLDTLMQEVFKTRLESFGLEVLTNLSQKGEALTVVIDLQEFKLDKIKGTIKRTWTGKMAYVVEISEKGKVLANNKIRGESEKLKIIRKQEADSLMSDLITDLANRLDAEALFRQAGI